MIAVSSAAFFWYTKVVDLPCCLALILLEVSTMPSLNLNHHLTIDDREIIAKSLSEGMNFKAIGKLISRHPSTIAREVGQHKESVKKRVSYSGNLNHVCQNMRDCSIKHLCSTCTSIKYCPQVLPCIMQLHYTSPLFSI